MTALTFLLFALGSAASVTLIGLLVLSLIRPSLRIWPTPGDGSWQGYVWWPLFRGLNVLCFGVAVLDRSAGVGLPAAMRVPAALLLAGAIAAFVTAFRVLGRDNSYCATDGLVSRGIYRWSRNPQNALLIVVYGCLAVAADGWPAYLLCAAMMVVYALMVLAEEPWLAQAYGAAYQRYRARVPRFFNWRRAAILARALVRRRRTGMAA